MSQHYKGYNLFYDVDDRDLRIRNRSTVLANIFEDNQDATKQGTVKREGAILLFGYFQNIPDDEKEEVSRMLESILLERGFKHA